MSSFQLSQTHITNFSKEKKKKKSEMGHLKLSSSTTTLLLVLLILTFLMFSADSTRTRVDYAMNREATGGNQAVGLHQRARINHGSYRGPRKHLVNPTVADVYTVPESSV